MEQGAYRDDGKASGGTKKRTFDNMASKFNRGYRLLMEFACQCSIQLAVRTFLKLPDILHTLSSWRCQEDTEDRYAQC